MNNNFGGEIVPNAYINTQSSIAANTGFLFTEEEKLDTSKLFWQSTEVLLKFAYPTTAVIESVNFPSDEEEKLEIPESSVMQQQLPAFPSYNEEDILNLDAVIITPPPREFGTIRVKLIYEEPSKPIPVDDPWE